MSLLALLAYTGRLLKRNAYTAAVTVLSMENLQRGGYQHSQERRKLQAEIPQGGCFMKANFCKLLPKHCSSSSTYVTVVLLKVHSTFQQMETSSCQYCSFLQNRNISERVSCTLSSCMVQKNKPQGVTKLKGFHGNISGKV